MKKIFAFSFILGALFFLNSCYILKQGKNLLKYHLRAKNIETLRKNSEINELENKLFENVLDIKDFCKNKLGISESKNYTSYIALEKDYILRVITASERLSFKSYMWKFPIFGEFPYKGFYNERDAREEAKRLKEKNYDVIIRNVDAFSTLGILSDPLYSFMTNYSIYSLANTIIHETMHTEIWIKDEVQFNEELAVFAAKEGALQYIRERFSTNSKEYREVIMGFHDRLLFKEFIDVLIKRLKKLYESSLRDDEKLKAKERIIKEYKTRYIDEYLPRFMNKGYSFFTNVEINNAYLTLYMTYEEDLSLFYEILKRYNGNIKDTIAFIKSVKKKDKNEKAKEYLRGMLR